MSNIKVPVITFDGSSGVGKGTLSKRVARLLNWNYLDSGLLYRLLALACLRHGVGVEDEAAISHIINKLDFNIEYDFSAPEVREVVYLAAEVVTAEVRREHCSSLASKLSANPMVRRALLAPQLSFAQPPGLVADGRDMGTIIFPAAEIKFFLHASAEVRAHRRWEQLQKIGVNASIERVFADIAARDSRDSSRAHAPLVPASDAIMLDTGGSTVSEVEAVIVGILKDKGFYC